jgi:hypothetical protein
MAAGGVRSGLLAFEAPGGADMDARREVIEELEGPPQWQSNELRYLRLARVMGEVAREVAGVPAGRPVDPVTLRSQLVDLGARALAWVDWLDEEAAVASHQARLALDCVS